VARRVRGLGGGEVTVTIHSGEAIDLLELWRHADALVLIDAVRSGGAPGEVHRIDASSSPIPARFSRSSSHAISAAEAIELGRALGRLPSTVVVYGVEAVRFAAGEPLSPAVEAAVQEAADAVSAEVRRLRSAPS
jgi:hydrogenase maturation protease